MNEKEHCAESRKHSGLSVCRTLLLSLLEEAFEERLKRKKRSNGSVTHWAIGKGYLQT
jgi:hypothetical protein